jgi:hypothetical protein
LDEENPRTSCSMSCPIVKDEMRGVLVHKFSQLNYSISLSRLELFVNPLTFTSKALYNKLHMLFFFFL